MPGLIPENILEEVLGRVNIVEVISGYIPLKRAGRNFKAVCPFHHEKTPSFMVSLDRQIYHCFGCGAGGNAFHFLMQYEHMEFPEAVETLAKKAGVILSYEQGGENKKEGLITQLYKINELASDFYARALISPQGAPARDYLLKRGITEQTMKSLRLGYAVEKWDALLLYLRGQGISLALLEKAGLIIAKENGGYYDRFRSRIIFPLFDIKSRIIAFGARILSSGVEPMAKYVNSPETPIYIKGNNLYGLNFAKEAVRQNDYLVMVEGYMDFIMPYQSGLKNIIASMGTALTSQQARLIKRFTPNVIIVYDGDSAGQSATIRALDIFIEEDMNVRVVALPEGYDPDSFLRKNGIDDFRMRIEQAEGLVDYRLRLSKSRCDIKTPEGKARVAAEILPLIKKFKNDILRAEYAKKVAEEINVAERDILNEMHKIKNPASDKGFLSPSKNRSVIQPTEKLLIKLMLEEAGVISRIRQNLEPADFQDEKAARLVSVMFDLVSQGRRVEPSALINYISDEGISEIVCESALSPAIPEQEREGVICDCIQRLKKEKMRLKKQYLHEEIKMAQQLGDEERINALMQEFHNLIRGR